MNKALLSLRPGSSLKKEGMNAVPIPLELPDDTNRPKTGVRSVKSERAVKLDLVALTSEYHSPPELVLSIV